MQNCSFLPSQTPQLLAEWEGEGEVGDPSEAAADLGSS
jgi:hypothetical protein